METTVLPSPEAVGVVAVTRMKLAAHGEGGIGEQIEFELGAVGADRFIVMRSKVELLRDFLDGQSETA